MLETSGNAGKWTGARYVLVLNVTLYIYSFPGLECKEGIGACPRPRKDVEDPCESHRHSRYPSLASTLPKCETSNLEHQDVIEDGSSCRSTENTSRRATAILEYDLATVVHELGGGHCLTALQKPPFAFPSRNALFERRQEYKLKITVLSLLPPSFAHSRMLSSTLLEELVLIMRLYTPTPTARCSFSRKASIPSDAGMGVISGSTSTPSLSSSLSSSSAL